MCVLANLEYLSILFCAVLWAAAPGLVAVLPMWDSVYVSGTVTSQAIGFPLANGRRVVPSGRLLSPRIRLIGSYSYYYAALNAPFVGHTDDESQRGQQILAPTDCNQVGLVLT